MTWEEVWRAHGARLAALIERKYPGADGDDAVSDAYLACVGREVRDPATYFGRVCRNEAKRQIKEARRDERLMLCTAPTTVRHNGNVRLIEEGELMLTKITSHTRKYRTQKTEWQRRKRAADKAA